MLVWVKRDFQYLTQLNHSNEGLKGSSVLVESVFFSLESSDSTEMEFGSL